MTWIPIEEQKPPDDSKAIWVVYQNAAEGLRFIRMVDWHAIKNRPWSEVNSRYTHWMPIEEPTLPPEKPKPVFEVPKDGKSYLCWHKQLGFELVFWSFIGESYKTERGAGIYMSNITRYMDEKGVWHERE